MKNRNWIYERYTSSLAPMEKDEEIITKWSFEYINTNILPHLPEDFEARILEIGCGSGRNIKAIQEIGYSNAYGIDISKEQIEYALDKLNLKNVSQQEPINFLSGKNNSYDAILLIDVLEHLDLEYSVELINIIRSSLKKGGVFIIQVPNALSPLSPHLYGDITHLRAYTSLSMEQHLRLGGFTEMKHKELPPNSKGVVSIIRRLIWFFCFKPVITAFMLAAYGGRINKDRVYTANMLTVAYKKYD